MHETEVEIVGSVEEWHQRIDAREAAVLGQAVANNDVVIVEPVANPEGPDSESRANSEQFLDYPDRRHSLRGMDNNGRTIFAKVAIAHKLYNCSCCPKQIDIGSEHVLTYAIQQSKVHHRHHVHNSCFNAKIVDNWSEVKVVNSSETEPAKLTKRSRNLRARQSRRQRGII